MSHDRLAASADANAAPGENALRFAVLAAVYAAALLIVVALSPLAGHPQASPHGSPRLAAAVQSPR